MQLPSLADTNGHAPSLDGTGMAGLPAPVTARWQPLRLGLLNLYRFDDEEFRFAGGRLLLRGNNGTGKSRILALTLPFLLDGEVGSHRLEPDGDTAKRIEWNLLLGRHDDRLGYTWIEFGRLEGDTARFVTLGIGMRAVKGRGLAQKWLFVTDRRLGDDLSLVGEAGQALTRDRLRGALQDRGEVFDTAEAYRAEVDQRLFGLGPHRYGALVDLLIQLRRPQLSRQMDEQVLSNALSEALPPLPHRVVSDVAEAFRTLEADREQLASFSAAADATTQFMTTYRRYAAVAVRRRANEVTATNGDYERTQRRLREAETDSSDAEARLTRLTDERDAARDDEHTFTEQARTLEASPAMDRVRELEHARSAATDAAARAGEAEQERDRAAEILTARERRVDEASAGTDASRAEVAEVVDRVAAAADAARLTEDHQRALAPLDLPDVHDLDELAVARAAADAGVTRRRDALTHLREVGAEVGARSRTVTTARGRREETAGALDRARDDERDAAAARDRTITEVLDDYRTWSEQLTELAVPASDELAWELETWRDAAGQRSPLARAIDVAVGDATRRLADARAGTSSDRDRLAEERDELTALRGQTASARHLPPPVPHTRDVSRRAGRPGAPLWQLVEPVTGLDLEEAAGYEAALEAAGLLDAWVTPDGAVLDVDDLDVALVAADGSPAPGGGLTAVLVPAVDREDARATDVDDATVRTILGLIGAHADDGHVWVAPDGRYRLGPVRGAWSKPTAEHLGHAAREAARRRRLHELDGQLKDLDRRLAELNARLRDLDERTATLATEHDAAPTDTLIREATAAHVAAVRQVAGLRERLADADAAVARAGTELERAEQARADAAADLGLGDVVDDLDEIGRHVGDYAAGLAALWPTVRGHAAALVEHGRSVADLDEARTSHRHHADRAAAARDTARAAETRRETLDATVGEQAEQILARLARARASLDEATARREQLDEDRVTAGGELQAAQQRMADLTEALDEHGERRAEAIRRLAAAVDAGLLPVASRGLGNLVEQAPDGEWSADRGVRLARRTDQALGDTGADDAAWSRVQQGIHGHYADLEHALLPHDLQPTASLADDLFVVTVPFQGASRSVPALHDLLVDEVTNRQALLTAREREILHNHLIGDVAAHLHGLLRAGEDWVAEVNAELDRMPTSTGVKLRFAWQARSDLPSFPAARRHLLGHHAGWTPEQRDEIGAFLQDRIAQVRESDPTGTWQHHLETALDHRAWHRFVVERYQDGQWTGLNRRSHGTGSGGEKALALTVPQFAAAAAHYRSAGEHAPRMIMLDEAFVGIDSSMRAKCLGLLEQFDLDLIMTSEREWGCYPSVPALAIAQLATQPGVDAVGISRWVWNGRERVRAER